MKAGKFFDEKEALAPEEREREQFRRLKEALQRAYERAPAAREVFERAGLKPSDIQSVKDLEKLPITRKPDIIERQRKDPPFGGFLAVPPEEVDRIFVTPGPIYGPHHTEKIDWFGKSFYAAGFRKGDIVINTATYHMSPAGILFHEGLRACGATVIPTGVGNTEAQIKVMLDLKVTGYAGMPSFLMTLIKKAEEMGYDFRRDFSLRKAWFTGEPLPPSMRQVFEEEYGIDTYQCYAATDLGGCVAYECKEKNGMHFMDEYLIEIVDPDTGRQLTPGEVGEIVATPLHNPVWGLIRYGTGDLASYTEEPCPCGRTSHRIVAIVGRSTDAVKVRGMFVVAKQVEEVFGRFEEVMRYQLVIDRKGARDELLLRVEVREGAEREDLVQRLTEEFPKFCRVRPDGVEILPPGSIEEGAEKIVDKRKWD